MSRYLIKTTEVYRTDTESEANQLVREAKDDRRYDVIKSTIENRQTKQKGEIVDEWKRVTITKEFAIEKEPDGVLMPEYLNPNDINKGDNDESEY